MAGSPAHKAVVGDNDEGAESSKGEPIITEGYRANTERLTTLQSHNPFARYSTAGSQASTEVPVEPYETDPAYPLGFEPRSHIDDLVQGGGRTVLIKINQPYISDTNSRHPPKPIVTWAMKSKKAKVFEWSCYVVLTITLIVLGVFGVRICNKYTKGGGNLKKSPLLAGVIIWVLAVVAFPFLLIMRWLQYAGRRWDLMGGAT